MSTVLWKLYDYKLVFFNLLLALVVGFLPPDFMQAWAPDDSLDYGLGIAMLVALLLEYIALVIERDFIYSMRGASTLHIPLIIQLSFFPRLLASLVFMSLSFFALGMLETDDFYFIPVAVYATAKELWVRAALLRPDENENRERGSALRVWLGGALFFLWICVGYYALWEIFLLDNPRYLLLILHPTNYAFVALAFLLLLLSLQMPLFLEEYARKISGKQWVLALSSLLLPVGALILRLWLMAAAR